MRNKKYGDRKYIKSFITQVVYTTNRKSNYSIYVLLLHTQSIFNWIHYNPFDNRLMHLNGEKIICSIKDTKYAN